mgnify:CR=1 FL=1
MSPINFSSELSKNTEPNWRLNLLFVSIAQFIAMMGMSSVVPFMPLYVRELGITDVDSATLWSGLCFAGPYFLYIITVPVWGAMGDRYGRKLMMSRAIYGLTIAVFLMGFAQNVWQLFALRVFQGGVSGMIAAALAFTSANTPNEKSGYAIGILQSSLSAGNIIGPFIGGIASDLGGTRFVFFGVSTLTFISGLLVILFVKEKKLILQTNEHSNFFSNLNYSLKNKDILFLLILVIITQVGISYTNPIFPYFLEEKGVPDNILSTMTGIMIGIVGFMSIFFAPYWGKRNDRKDYRKTVFLSSLIVGISGLLHVFAPNYFYLFPLRFIIGVFFAAIIPTLYAALNKYAPDSNKGGIMGMASSANLMGSLIGFLGCGILSAKLGNDSAFIISGLLLILAAILIKIKTN